MLKNPKLGLAVAGLAAFSMWFYVQKILIPYQQADAALHEQPRGILSDLYPRWVGARELLLHGTNPYSADVTRQIQQGYYGRVLDPQRPDDPRDEQRFAYPVYVVFLLAPTIRLPFDVVRSGFTVLLVLITTASVLMWMRAVRWEPSFRAIGTCVLLTLGSFPVAQGIKLQQLSLLVAGFLGAAAAAVSCGFLITGGILLALATIKPQVAWLLVAGMMLWAARDWRNRQKLAWSFGSTLVLLLLGSYLVLPTWIADFLEAVRAYHRYTRNVSVLGLLFTPALGDVIAVLLVLTTFWIVWPLLGQPADHRNFGTAVVTLAALGVLVAPMFAPYNQVLLVPAVMLLASQGEAIWRRNTMTRLLTVLAALALLWPWLASAILAVALVLSSASSVEEAWSLPLYTTFIIPILVFALMALWAAKAEPA